MWIGGLVLCCGIRQYGPKSGQWSGRLLSWLEMGLWPSSELQRALATATDLLLPGGASRPIGMADKLSLDVASNGEKPVGGPVNCCSGSSLDSGPTVVAGLNLREIRAMDTSVP